MLISNHNYNFLQQGAGNYEDSEESEFSSQGTESFQKETEHLEPWSCIFDEAENRHETQLNALNNQYEENGDSKNVARIKAENAVLPVYRKELRKVLLENLQWMRAMKKDPTLKKVMETQIKELKGSEGFDWLGSTELLSISENSYSFDCTKSSPFHKMKTRPTMNVIGFFPGPLYCCVSIKTVSNHTLNVFYR